MKELYTPKAIPTSWKHMAPNLYVLDFSDCMKLELIYPQNGGRPRYASLCATAEQNGIVRYGDPVYFSLPQGELTLAQAKNSAVKSAIEFFEKIEKNAAALNNMVYAFLEDEDE